LVWHRGSAVANASMRLTWPGRCADNLARIGRHRGGSLPSLSSRHPNPCALFCAGEGRVHAVKTNMRTASPRRSPQPQPQPAARDDSPAPCPVTASTRRAPCPVVLPRPPACRPATTPPARPGCRHLRLVTGGSQGRQPCSVRGRLAKLDGDGAVASSGSLGEESKRRAEFCRF